MALSSATISDIDVALQLGNSAGAFVESRSIGLHKSLETLLQQMLVALGVEGADVMFVLAK